MRQYIALTRRNCSVFLKDRPAVAFSLLSMFIVLILMAVFLGKLNTDAVTGLLEQYGGTRNKALDKEHAEILVRYWALAGIMEVNAVTVTLTVMGTMVSDAAENRLSGFYCAPVRRELVALGYVTSACLIGMLFCTAVFAAGLGYIVLTGGELLAISAVVKMLGYILMNVCVFSIIMFLAASFVKSSSAWSGFATVVGTLVGFAGAVYIPMGSLPAGAAEALAYTPILHGASLMRKVCCRDILAETFFGLPESIKAAYEEQMGISAAMGGETVSSGFQLLFIGLFGLAALAAAIWLEKRGQAGDRSYRSGLASKPAKSKGE